MLPPVYRSRRVISSVAIVLLLLLGAVLPTISAPKGGSGLTHDIGLAKEPPLRASGTSVPFPHGDSPAPGATIRTLSLFNNTLTTGNFLPNNTFTPAGVTYDAADRTVWFTASNNVGVANATTGEGIAYLPSAGTASGIAYDNRSDRVFAADYATDTVSAFDALTNTKIASIAVGYSPLAVIYDWETDQVYVTEDDNAPGFENVTVINATTLVVEAGVPVGAGATAEVFVASTHQVWVVNSLSDNITIIDPTTLTVTGSLPLYGGDPKAAVFDRQDDLVYVANAGTGVEIYDPATPAAIGNISYASVGSDPAAIAVDAPLHTLYIANTANGSVSAVDTVGNVVEAQPNLGIYSQPDAAVYDPTDHRVLVACEDAFQYAGSNITEISTATNSTVVAIPIELIPEGAVYDAQTRSIYTYDGGSGDIDQINDSTDLLTRSVFVGYTPHTIGLYVGGLALDPLSGDLYVSYATSFSGDVSLVNLSTFTVVQNLSATDFDGPSGIAYDPTDAHIFVANYYGDTVVMLNALTGAVLSSTVVGDRPIGVTFDPANDQVLRRRQLRELRHDPQWVDRNRRRRGGSRLVPRQFGLRPCQRGGLRRELVQQQPHGSFQCDRHERRQHHPSWGGGAGLGLVRRREPQPRSNVGGRGGRGTRIPLGRQYPQPVIRRQYSRREHPRWNGVRPGPERDVRSGLLSRIGLHCPVGRDRPTAAPPGLLPRCGPRDHRTGSGHGPRDLDHGGNPAPDVRGTPPCRPVVRPRTSPRSLAPPPPRGCIRSASMSRTLPRATGRPPPRSRSSRPLRGFKFPSLRRPPRSTSDSRRR